MKTSYLLDKDFLKFLDLQKIKEQYIKITVLDWKENPLQDITGIATGGSINIDGSSSVRRTANLSIFVKDKENNITQPSFLLSLNKKVKIEIGIKTTVVSEKYKHYQNIPIFWFPMGIYVIIQHSISHGTGGTTISLQLKDKMCLLNGECGGTLPATVIFNEIATYDENGNETIFRPTIYQIIQEAVNHWGGEQLGKILIGDLSSRIRKVVKWNGNAPLYCYIQYEKDSEGNMKNNGIEYTTEENVIQSGTKVFSFEELKKVPTESSLVYIQYLNGQDIGYVYTDFSYPNGELIGNAGDSVCSILDQLRDTLGNFEYFYDLDGNFRFQEIKNYLNTSQSTIEIQNLNKDPQHYVINQAGGKTVYSFDDSSLITSYNNNPQINMIKNDFIVWGERETPTGIKVPIRYHLAIDDKPQPDKDIEHIVFKYKDPYDHLDKAKVAIPRDNIETAPPGVPGLVYVVHSNGQYLFYEWNPKLNDYQLVDKTKFTFYIFKYPIEANNSITPILDWRTELYLEGAELEGYGLNSNDYYVELINEWPKIYDIWGERNKENSSSKETETTLPGFYDAFLNTPSDGSFYLDFIDTNGPLGEFKISNIGKRTKAIVDPKINCLFAPDLPNVVIIEAGTEETEQERKECENQGQDFSQVSQIIYQQLVGGGGFNSAYDAIKDLLYQYTSYNESVSLQTIPIYYLDVNTRIEISDIESDIKGEYIINSISIPLDISSTMSISATKAAVRI